LSPEKADVLQKLRHRIEQMQHFAGRLPAFDELRQYLKRGNRAVACRGMVEKDHMPRLFTTDIDTMLAHFFENIAVTDFGTHQFQMLAFQIALKPKVGHHRRNNTVARKFARAAHRSSEQSHDLVTVDYLAMFIDNDQSVGIAVKRNANIRAAETTVSCKVATCVDPTLSLMFLPFGSTPMERYLGTQLPNGSWCDLIGCTIRAIENDM
jgi:hypothetical protein